MPQLQVATQMHANATRPDSEPILNAIIYEQGSCDIGIGTQVS